MLAGVEYNFAIARSQIIKQLAVFKARQFKDPGQVAASARHPGSEWQDRKNNIKGKEKH